MFYFLYFIRTQFFFSYLYLFFVLIPHLEETIFLYIIKHSIQFYQAVAGIIDIVCHLFTLYVI
jgi:hypothetical protein